MSHRRVTLTHVTELTRSRGLIEQQEASAPTTAAPVTQVPSTGATTAEGSATDAPSGYCAVAQEMEARDDFPTVEQMESARDLAPPEIADALSTAAAAARVDVVASDYAFAFDEPIAPGRTSFVLTNEGQEAHFLLLTRFVEGATLEQALSAESPEEFTDGEWETDLAAIGGEDEEIVTLDLDPGRYAMLCFIPGASGEPHAFVGMTAEFTVG